MPDAIDPRRGDDAAPGWAAAFARLPLETPPVDSLQRFTLAVQAQARRAQAPRRDRRGNWAVGLASAAVLALVIGSALFVRTPAPPARITAQDVARQAERTARADAGVPASSAASPPSPAQDVPTTPELRLVQRALPGLERVFPAASTRVDRAQARRATDHLVSALPLEQIVAASDAAARTQALAQLQQRSQQLEALIAMARDERVGTGAGVAMTGELDAEIARVDIDLQQPDIAPAQRVALWQQRVDALEHLAGVTTTQRWLSAQGAFDQVALVNVD